MKNISQALPKAKYEMAHKNDANSSFDIATNNNNSDISRKNKYGMRRITSVAVHSEI